MIEQDNRSASACLCLFVKYMEVHDGLTTYSVITIRFTKISINHKKEQLRIQGFQRLKDHLGLK